MSRTSTWPLLLVLACGGAAPEDERAQTLRARAPEATAAGAPAAKGGERGPDDGAGQSDAKTDAKPGTKIDTKSGAKTGVSDPSGPGTPDPNDPAPSLLEELPLPPLDLRALAPRDAEVRQAILREGVSIHADELNVQVALAGPQTPATLAAAKAEAELFAPTKLREVTLSDGWLLTFESATAMGPSFWVQLRRDIGGRTIWCTSTSSSAQRQLAALDLCTSLRPS